MAIRAQVLAVTMLLLATAISAAAEIRGKARVVDGGTVEIAGRRLRLAGIGAPALDQVCHRAGHAYDCGKVARAVLWDLIGGREVACQPVADGGRATPENIVAICTAGEVNLGEGMVAAGWAQADPTAAETYGTLEDDAKAARRGLWSGTFDRPQSGGGPTE